MKVTINQLARYLVKMEAKDYHGIKEFEKLVEEKESDLLTTYKVNKTTMQQFVSVEVSK